MPLPKRKTDLSVYKGTELTKRRQELLDKITKSDSFLPDSVLHDDLDKGMLDYVNETFVVESDGIKIPIVNKILTVQRWGEFANNWEFSDKDGNMELPFVAIIRKPEVQLGTNPSVQRTIPDRHQIYYASVPTWNGTSLGADIYTIPQPIPVDISYDVTIVCNKFRDINKFNRKVLQNFASRQDYTTIKGHYIPIVLDKVEDNTPMDTLDGRRFYMQTYSFTMLGYLIDNEEFEVKPAISRLFTMFEFITDNKYKKKKVFNKDSVVQKATIMGDGAQTVFSVGESIGTLFEVLVNGEIQTKDVNYLHVAYTSKIEFIQTPGQPTFPAEGDVVTILYYKGKSNKIAGDNGKVLQFVREEFHYTGNEPTGLDGNPYYILNHEFTEIITVEINGLAEQENIGYEVYEAVVNDVNVRTIKLLGIPAMDSKVSIGYLY
jgi:hypothetical protein